MDEWYSGADAERPWNGGNAGSRDWRKVLNKLDVSFSNEVSSGSGPGMEKEGCWTGVADCLKRGCCDGCLEEVAALLARGIDSVQSSISDKRLAEPMFAEALPSEGM